MKKWACYALAVFMTISGLNHFLAPWTYEQMVPRELGHAPLLVQLSGVAEIAGGLGLLWSKTRRFAAYGLIVLFIAVFPANLNMAVNHLKLGTKDVPAWTLWARLPLQLVLIAWAWWVRDAAALSRRRSSSSRR